MEVKKKISKYSSPHPHPITDTSNSPSPPQDEMDDSFCGKTKPKELHTQGDYANKRVEDRCLIKIRIWWKWDSQPPFLALLQAIILSEYIPDRKLVDSSLGKLPRRTELQILTFVSFKMKQQGPCLTTPQWCTPVNKHHPQPISPQCLTLK